jgi:hypothetical protein
MVTCNGHDNCPFCAWHRKFEKMLTPELQQEYVNDAIKAFQSAVRNRLARENVIGQAQVMGFLFGLIHTEDDRMLSVNEIRLLTGYVQLGLPWTQLRSVLSEPVEEFVEQIEEEEDYGDDE